MKRPAIGSNGTGLAPADGFVDQRKAARYVLLLRTAKLVTPEAEYPCIVRDVSASGARLRLFHPLPPQDTLMIELATGERIPVECRWNRDGQFGFRFFEEIDVRRFIEETSPHPRRPLRLRMTFAAQGKAQGEVFELAVRDLSRQGARIETLHPLAIGQKLRVAAPGFPEREAAVCWRDAPAHGLVFHHAFAFEELAAIAWRLQTARGEPKAFVFRPEQAFGR